MNPPGFTAQASLYRTSGRYRASASESGISPPSKAIVPAYLPGPDTQARCNSCMEKCTDRASYCNTAATALLAGCVFPPLCPAAAAAAGAALADCQALLLGCTATCSLPRPELFGVKLLGESPCCPKVCGFTHPFAHGEGCCDEGEHCVDSSIPMHVQVAARAIKSFATGNAVPRELFVATGFVARPAISVETVCTVNLCLSAPFLRRHLQSRRPLTSGVFSLAPHRAAKGVVGLAQSAVGF